MSTPARPLQVAILACDEVEASDLAGMALAERTARQMDFARTRA